MTWIDIGYNAYEDIGYNAYEDSEGGFKKVRACFGRVPCVGERIEFRDPEGGVTDWPTDLDGGVFFVAEVNWIVAKAEGGPQAHPSIFVVPKSMWEDG